MIVVDLRVVQELYRYNRWANERVFEAVSGLRPEDFTKDLSSSHPSVRHTLTHIVWAEWIWLQRWKGTSPKDVFEAKDFPRLDTLRVRWSEVEIDQRVFIETLTTEALLERVHYVNLQGHAWQYPLWRQMYHVVNHSTYHRGQLTAMLRQLAALPVPTDFLVFHDEVETDHVSRNRAC